MTFHRPGTSALALAAVVAFLAVVAAIPMPLAAQTSISTGGPQPPIYGTGLWGLGGYGTWQGNTSGARSIFGQTFRAPSSPNTLLESLSYYLSDDGPPTGGLFYRVYVQAWDDALQVPGTHYWPGVSGMPIGPVLFRSDLQYVGAVLQQTRFAVATGGVNLTPDQLFVFFLQAESGTGYKWVGMTGDDTYTDGKRVVWDEASTGGQWWPTVSDLTFTATFNAAPTVVPETNVVPEPVTMLLLGTGLLGVGASARRRRRERDAED